MGLVQTFTNFSGLILKTYYFKALSILLKTNTKSRTEKRGSQPYSKSWERPSISIKLETS